MTQERAGWFFTELTLERRVKVKVKEIMSAYVTSCGPNATLVEAAGVMRGYNCGTLQAICKPRLLKAGHVQPGKESGSAE